MRKYVLVVLAVALILTGCGNLAVSSSKPEVIKDSRQIVYKDYPLVGLSYIGRETLSDRMARFPFHVPATPIRVGNILFMRFDKNVYGSHFYEIFKAFNDNGDVIWTATLEHKSDYNILDLLKEGGISDIVRYYPEPAIATDGKDIYIVMVETKKGDDFSMPIVLHVYKYTVEGKLLWHSKKQFYIAETFIYPLIRRVRVSNNMLYVLVEGLGVYGITFDGKRNYHFFTTDIISRPVESSILPRYISTFFVEDNDLWDKKNAERKNAISTLSYWWAYSMMEVDGEQVIFVSPQGIVFLDKHLQPQRAIPFEALRVVEYDNDTYKPLLVVNGESDKALYNNILDVRATKDGIFVLARGSFSLAPFPETSDGEWPTAEFPYNLYLMYIDKHTGVVYGKTWYGMFVGGKLIVGKSGEVFVGMEGMWASRDELFDSYPLTAPAYSDAIVRVGVKDHRIVEEDIYKWILEPQDLPKMVGEPLVMGMMGNSRGVEPYDNILIDNVAYVDENYIVGSGPLDVLYVIDRKTGKVRSIHQLLASDIESYNEYIYRYGKGMKLNISRQMPQMTIALYGGVGKHVQYPLPWYQYDTYTASILKDEKTKRLLDSVKDKGGVEYIHSIHPFYPRGILIYWDWQHDVAIYLANCFESMNVHHLIFVHPSKVVNTTMKHIIVGKPASNRKWHHVDKWNQKLVPQLTIYDDAFKVKKQSLKDILSEYVFSALGYTATFTVVKNDEGIIKGLKLYYYWNEKLYNKLAKTSTLSQKP